MPGSKRMIPRASLASYEDLLDEDPALANKNQPFSTPKNLLENFNKRKHENSSHSDCENDEPEDGEVNEKTRTAGTKNSPKVVKALSKRSNSLKEGPADAKTRPRGTEAKKAKTEARPQEQRPKQQNPKGSEKRVPAPFVPRVVCRYFMEGICSKGDRCTFSHNVTPNKTPEEARKAETCKYFIVGSCMKGAACQFSHDLSTVPCRYHHVWRTCTAGNTCRFSHAPIGEEELARLRSEVESKAAVSKPPAADTLPPVTLADPEKEDNVDDDSTAAFLNPFAAVDF